MSSPRPSSIRQNRSSAERTPPIPAKVDKGKSRAVPPPSQVDTPLASALQEALDDDLPDISGAIDEAISSPLTSTLRDASLRSVPNGLGTTSYSPISPPPLAHHPTRSASGGIMPPRLLSALTRSTLPTASLSYASAAEPKARAASWSGSGSGGESSKRALYGGIGSGFPDLDPTTGLPLGTSIDDVDVDADGRSLYLQRTITDLLANPTTSTRSLLPSLPGLPTIPTVTMPKLPTLPALPPLPSLPWSIRSGSATPALSRQSSRGLSTSAPQEDWASWTSWWSGNKGKVDRMMSEDDQAGTVEEEREKHRRKYRTPKHPLVFCHGLLGFDFIGPASLPPLQISHWRGIREVLESNGVDVLITRVPATASIQDRAATLNEMISEKYPGQEINLIAHSMGGLDCRYLISTQPKGFKPISLTTISTPHRGSPFADYLIDNVIGRERLPSLLSLLQAMRLPESGDGSAFNALGTRSMKEFNAQIINDPDVKYFSWGASFEPGLLDTFKWPHSVVLAKEGPNDGLVSVHSARWGEYRGTLLGVNHLDLVGWVNHVRYAIAGWTGTPIAFKPATFYLEISDYLAEQGF